MINYKSTKVGNLYILYLTEDEVVHNGKIILPKKYRKCGIVLLIDKTKIGSEDYYYCLTVSKKAQLFRADWFLLDEI